MSLARQTDRTSLSGRCEPPVRALNTGYWSLKFDFWLRLGQQLKTGTWKLDLCDLAGVFRRRKRPISCLLLMRFDILLEKRTRMRSKRCGNFKEMMARFVSTDVKFPSMQHWLTTGRRTVSLRKSQSRREIAMPQKGKEMFSCLSLAWKGSSQTYARLSLMLLRRTVLRIGFLETSRWHGPRNAKS